VKSLRDEWYDRLAADGFVDLESRRDVNGALSGSAGGAPRQVIGGKGDYYQAARLALHDPSLPWRTGRARRIIEMHVDGVGHREIRRRLRCRRSFVEETTTAFTRWLRRKKHGRTSVIGCGRQSWRLTVRLSDAETDALWSLAARLGCKPHEAAREAIRAAARGVVVSTQPKISAGAMREIVAAGVDRTES